MNECEREKKCHSFSGITLKTQPRKYKGISRTINKIEGEVKEYFSV